MLQQVGVGDAKDVQKRMKVHTLAAQARSCRGMAAPGVGMDFKARMRTLKQSSVGWGQRLPAWPYRP